MPYELGPNAYKNANAPTQWFNDPNDPGAIARVYGNLTTPTPYYQYPVLIQNEDYVLVQADNVEQHQLFQIQFNELMRQVNELAKQLNVKVEALEVLGANVMDDNFLGVNLVNEIVGDAQEENFIVITEDTKRVNVVDSFAENILCGFNGITTGKFAFQLDPQLFADIKMYVEVILNAMLKDIPNARGTLIRFIAAISACEGGAWADLKIMSTEINASTELFGCLEKSRERLSNAISYEFVMQYKEYFDHEENVNIETHVNVLTQTLFALLGKLKKPPIEDINVAKLKLGETGAYKVVFASAREADLAARYLVSLETFVNFEKKFDSHYTFSNILDNVANHILEQLRKIYQQYVKIVNDAMRESQHITTMIRNSINDAKSDCITKVEFLLKSFDAPSNAYMLVLNHDLENADETLTLKSADSLEFWCRAFAAHSIKMNQVIKGFYCEYLPGKSGNAYFLVSTIDKTIQWIETPTGQFVTPYEYLDDNPGVHPYLIHNATTKPFLIGVLQSISNYRIIMKENDAFKEDVELIQQRYFVRRDFKQEDTTSELALACQEDNVPKIKCILSMHRAKSAMMAKNIIVDLIGRAFWDQDLQFEIIELMIKACPDLRSALTHEEEVHFVEWAIKSEKSDVLCLLVAQSISLRTTFAITQLIPIQIKLPLLHAAVFCEFDDLVDACLKRDDLDVNAMSNAQRGYPSALHTAAISANMSILDKLLHHPDIITTHTSLAMHLPTPVEIAIQDNNLAVIAKLLSAEPFESVLERPFLLALRKKYGLPELFNIVNVDPDSLKAYQLWAKTTVMCMEEDLNNPDRHFSTEAQDLIKAKIEAIKQAIQGTDIAAIFEAIKMPCTTSVSYYWLKAPPPSPAMGIQPTLFAK